MASSQGTGPGDPQAVPTAGGVEWGLRIVAFRCMQELSPSAQNVGHWVATAAQEPASPDRGRLARLSLKPSTCTTLSLSPLPLSLSFLIECFFQIKLFNSVRLELGLASSVTPHGTQRCMLRMCAWEPCLR